jgi:hypothetical protein
MYITETYILYYDDNYVIWVWIVLWGSIAPPAPPLAHNTLRPY